MFTTWFRPTGVFAGRLVWVSLSCGWVSRLMPHRQALPQSDLPFSPIRSAYAERMKVLEPLAFVRAGIY